MAAETTESQETRDSYSCAVVIFSNVITAQISTPEALLLLVVHETNQEDSYL